MRVFLDKIIIRRRLYQVLLLITILGQATGQDNSSTSHAMSVNKPESLSVHDSTDYSSKFLRELHELSNKEGSFILKGSLLILVNADTFQIPQTPAIGEKMLFTAKQGELAIALTVERINQVVLKYRLEMVEFGFGNYHKRGLAEIPAAFYLGAESDENPRTGLSYLATEFYDDRDSCYCHIRIGQPSDSIMLMAKLVKNCNGKLMDINLDNYRSLYRKN